MRNRRRKEKQRTRNKEQMKELSKGRKIKRIKSGGKKINVRRIQE
jgi:hypothetical protein